MAPVPDTVSVFISVFCLQFYLVHKYNFLYSVFLLCYLSSSHVIFFVSVFLFSYLFIYKSRRACVCIYVCVCVYQCYLATSLLTTRKTSSYLQVIFLSICVRQKRCCFCLSLLSWEFIYLSLTPSLLCLLICVGLFPIYNAFVSCNCLIPLPLTFFRLFQLYIFYFYFFCS